MNIEGIINVSGKPGLHKIISRGKNTIIVESLLDKKRMPVYPHTPANALEEISIYTYEETVPLLNVLSNIAKKENCKPCMSAKSSVKDLQTYFREVIQNYDEERVYLSDIKKVLQWYNTLQTAGLIRINKESKPEKNKNEENEKNKDTNQA